jgi:hypothetical protein
MELSNPDLNQPVSDEHENLKQQFDPLASDSTKINH